MYLKNKERKIMFCDKKVVFPSMLTLSYLYDNKIHTHDFEFLNQANQLVNSKKVCVINLTQLTPDSYHKLVLALADLCVQKDEEYSVLENNIDC